jgi:PAS domain S-box-containing protein
MKELIAASNKLNGNLKKASSFAQSIGEGNYTYQFEPVSSEDQLGNALVTMRNQLKTISETDRKRNWAAEGLAKFAELMRLDHDFRNLANAMISELVKYLEANQGGIFILNDDDQAHPYLEMTGCYAYERIKHVKKKFEFGQGLIGQCFLEKETIYLLEVPKDYVSITSGLGDATPQCMLIVPLRLNDDVEGVIELATFKPFEKYEVEFVEKVGEIMASSISNAKINYRTRTLLEESQQRTEELRAQEEEMRQNMEELQATQEDLQRKNEEFISMQNKLQMEQSMFLTLMDFITDRITYKDTESRIVRVNKAKAARMKMQPQELIGKSDYDFFSNDHADKAFNEEQEILRSGNPVLDQEEKLVYQDGSISYASTSRVPFRDESNRTAGMFIITRDVTKLKLAEETISEQKDLVTAIQDNLNLIVFIIDAHHKLIVENPIGLEKIGLRQESVIDKTFYQLFNQDPEKVTLPFSFVASGVQFQLVRKNSRGEITGFGFRK